MSDSILKHILKDKVNDSTEIELHLFTFCNLSCSFCGQDHDSTEGLSIDSIESKADLVIDFIEQSGKDSHIINIMGGEIFNDDVPDEIFEGYEKFYQKINAFSKNTRFNWVTNLIFQKSDRVKAFVEGKSNCFISTSYDFAGRGLDLNKNLQWRHNLKIFEDKITVIGFVLTKPAIKKILNKEDKFFSEYLYSNFNLYFDYYVPERTADKMMPSEREMLDCMLFVAEKYPNIYPVKDMLERAKNKMTCYSMNKVTILPDNKKVTCRYLEYKEGDFLNEVDYSSNSNIIEAHLDRHSCLGCKWFDRCQFRCFVQADWAALERLDDCMFRMFFNEMEGRGGLDYQTD